MRTPITVRTSYFVSSVGQPRVRRPRDFATVVLGLLLILWAVVTVDHPSNWEAAFIELVQSSPAWVSSLLGFGYALSLVYAIVVIAALIKGGRDRRKALRDTVIVATGAGVLVVTLSFLINGAWPYVFPEIDLQDPVPQFPVMRMAIVTAILVVVSPHVTRPLRRFGWLAIASTALASVGLSYGSPAHTLGSFGVGLLSAGLLLVIAGSPRGYPDPDVVKDALRSLGVPSEVLEPAPVQTWGVVRFTGRYQTEGEFDVKVYGRDAFDSQLASKVWHTLWYRETGPTVVYSRVQAVEHEALMTVLAGRAGVTVPDLLAVGSASPELALVAFHKAGTPLTGIDPQLISDVLLVEIWSQVRRLHEKSMSHGSLHARTIHVGPNGPVITDMALGSLAADPADQGADICELLFSLGDLVGVDRAVSTAMTGLGRDRMVEALPYLQLPALSPATRRSVKESKQLMAALRTVVSEQTGADLPEPIRLRRVTVRTVVMAALVLLLALAIIPALANIDYAQVWAVLESANWVLMILALLVGHLQFFATAIATMFAVPAKLPFWPLLTLQTASAFIGLAIPSAAGRVAMNAAFLHKFGMPVTVAIAQGAIDGFSGFLVQMALLILLPLVGDVDLSLDIDPSQVRWLLVLAVLALIVVGVVTVVLRVRALRDRIVPVVRQGWGAFKVVLQQPSRAIGLLGSNFVYWNILGLTLWLLLQAVGLDVSYGTALFVSSSANLVAGFMPVPGGVGVYEAALIALLVAFGVDESSALAVTVSYRVITFYLPAVEGFFGTRWLERHEYL